MFDAWQDRLQDIGLFAPYITRDNRATVAERSTGRPNVAAICRIEMDASEFAKEAINLLGARYRTSADRTTRGSP